MYKKIFTVDEPIIGDKDDKYEKYDNSAVGRKIRAEKEHAEWKREQDKKFFCMIMIPVWFLVVFITAVVFEFVPSRCETKIFWDNGKDVNITQVEQIADEMYFYIWDISYHTKDTVMHITFRRKEATTGCTAINNELELRVKSRGVNKK